MTLSVAIQMDPLEGINIDGDSTFVLGLEAQQRGFSLYYYHHSTLSLIDGDVCATLYPLTLRREQGHHFTLGKPTLQSLSHMDVVLMRQDPPFDMAYITATYLLERVSSKVRVINNPVEVRNCPEKLFVFDFADYMPATILTRELSDILAFKEQHKDVVIKPLHGYGGKDIYHSQYQDSNLSALFNLMLRTYSTPMVVQEFLPEIAKGDKRVVLIDGEVAGAFSRIPKPGEIRANLVVGGTAEVTELSHKEQEICAALKPELKRRGLYLVGIDIIGERLTEINVTSPTGLQTINQLYGKVVESEFWDVVESL